MSVFQNLSYFAASGMSVPVGHPQDDPYIGKPPSKFSIAMRNEGAVGLQWTYQGVAFRKGFSTDIQAVLEIDGEQILVIGHGCANLDSHLLPNNGVILTPDGKAVGQIEAPLYILSSRNSDGSPISPDGLSSIESSDGLVRIWLSYWQGEWYEQRIYKPKSNSWGSVTGHFRSR